MKTKQGSCQQCSRRKVRCSRDSCSGPCFNCIAACVVCCARVPPRNPDERSHKARVLKPAEIKKLSNNTQGCAKQIQDIYSREEPLPCFIQPLRNGLDKYDRRYLSIKGVFNLPDAHLQNVLLRAYIENIHPLLPVLELDSFIEAIFTLHDQTTSKPQSWVSLLLYWAVMYSAISTVTPETIQKAGFHSRHDAQCSFFGRIKALYDMEAELDTLTLAQALLLVVYVMEITRDTKDITYWVSIISSHIQAHGIDEEVRQGHQCSEIDERTRRLYRRIWWSCFVCDRLIALAACVDPVLPRNNVPLLELDDLEVFTCPRHVVDAVGSEMFSNSDISIYLGHLCVIQTRVYLVLDDMISGSVGRSPVQLQHLTIDQAAVELARLRRCTEELLSHYDQLKLLTLRKDKILPEKTPGLPQQVKNSKPVHFHEVLLFIIIDAVLAFLLQRQIILQENFLSSDGSPSSQGTDIHVPGPDQYQLHNFPRQSRISITRRICLRFIHLKQNDQLHKLRSIVVALLLPAAINQLVLVCSAGHNLQGRNSAIYFNLCLSVLQSLERDKPSVTEWIMYLQRVRMGSTACLPPTYLPPGRFCSLGGTISSDIEPQLYPNDDLNSEPIQMAMKWWFGDGKPIS